MKVIFVCWGNICRSPMGERVARKRFAEAGLGHVDITSAAVSTEELGNPIDRRARAVLDRHGFDSGGHRAHKITAAEIADADLVLGFEPIHVSRMRAIAPEASNLGLVTDFDPDAAPGSGIDDPWYGDAEGFNDTLASIEAAMPGIIARVRELQK
ncbi:MAG TPA: low molecular weight protein-tyrosine-phosphatase [Propioniciclava tarda]|nr:low molecular weight protein-tyrosine-phosphatase [Propioniciclava tarda]HQA31759.1 low molecular weight protein-tyrosine-phosphatase [Propioniciclava tarda]HQD61786.1 low molecular weight protein-tyrosine-phosphatase [Propioniciclava tarda]